MAPIAHLYSSLFSRLLAALFLLSLCQAAFADPPGRVGRLADLQGQVWMYDDETADWAAAVRNRPLTTGDRVSTDGNGRAELRVGSTTLRLDAGTEIEVLQLDDDFVRVQLHNGNLSLRLRTHEAAREVELVTAEGRFKPERAGRYRLDRLDATASITVWSGQLLFEAPDNAVTLSTGQRADILASYGRTQYTLVQPQRDAFADEVAASELADERSVSARYVSPEMTGAEELDRHGRWESDTDHGALWVPRAVAPGWAPYRFGHWAWVRPWGWTWVDDAPWGFAPFHYGRWVFLRNNWCWSPGRWVARPVYAPALVAWVGAPGVSISIGGPRVGWFPLGPREVFVPGYRSSPTYVRNVNVTQVTNITNVTTIINSPNTVVQQTNYINRGVPGAVTVVPANVVSGRQPVAPSRVQITDPRPGRGNHDLQVAALPTVTAAAPVQTPPAAPRNLVVPSARPGAAAPGGLPYAGPDRPVTQVPANPGGVAAAPPRAVVPPPITQPVVRNPRPPQDRPPTPTDGSARPIPLPSPTAPPRAAPVRPPSPALDGPKTTLPAPIPPSMVPPRAAPGPAAGPPPRQQSPSGTVTAPRAVAPTVAAPPAQAPQPAQAAPAAPPAAARPPPAVAVPSNQAAAARARDQGDPPRGVGKPER